MNIFRTKADTDYMTLLIQSAENALQGAHLFRTAMMGLEPPADHFPPMKELEHKGDEITHRIFKGLNKKCRTPLDRKDIWELASKLDNVIDGIEATLARFDYLNVKETDEYMKEFSAIFVSSCQHILDAFKLLSHKKYLQITEHTVLINSLENEGDRLMREGIREIFLHQRDPYTDFKLKELYERMEETTDACEDVADILGSVVLRYS